jgi:hypothetical protein
MFHSYHCHEHPSLAHKKVVNVLPNLVWKFFKAKRHNTAKSYFADDIHWFAALDRLPLLGKILAAAGYPPHLQQSPQMIL